MPDLHEPITIGRNPLTIEHVLALARGGARARLDQDPSYRAHLEAGPRSGGGARAR